MNITMSRNPIIIARILGNNEIKWDINSFLHILKQANGKFIRFIVFIGGFQKGKTSFISLITGNDKHKIGNGSDSETIGATIDGPFTIHTLAKRWQINKLQNIKEDEALFFVDIEGFGWFNRGESEAQIKAFYSKLCGPLIAISSSILFLVNENENFFSIDQIVSTLRFGEFAIQNVDKENKNNTSFELMTIVLNIQNYNGINYSHPNSNNYKKISNLLTNNWQKNRFKCQNCNVSSKPLPLYDKNNTIFNQNEDFNKGFKFVVTELLDNLMTKKARIKTNNPNSIIHFVNTICNLKNPFDSKLIKNASANFFTQVMCDEIKYIYNTEMPSDIDSFFQLYLNKQNECSLLDDIILDEEAISCTIMNYLFTKFDKILLEKTKEYLVYPEVRNKITEISVLRH